MSNATIIGSASEFNGVTTFKSQPIITSTILANTDSSTNIATTAWSNAFWTYVKTQANTWSGAQTFTTTTTDTITAPTITSNMTIGSNLNGGTVTIGATSTTTINGVTAINIGTDTTQTGNIAIGTNNAVLSGTNQIFIGASNKTTNISGSAINMSGVININTIGTALTTIGATGNNTNISGTAINIGNTAGNPATNGVNIASGTNVAGSSVFIGSETLTTSYIRGINVNINHQTLKNTNIGSDAGGTPTLLGNIEFGSNGAGTINVWRPLTPNYSLSFTSGQIGYSSSSSVSGTLVSNVYSNLILPSLTGVYVITTLIEVAATFSSSYIYNYDFQMGLNGIGYKSRIFITNPAFFSNLQHTLTYVYSSSGPTNTNSARAYSNVYLLFDGSASFSITTYYTRVA